MFVRQKADSSKMRFETDSPDAVKSLTKQYARFHCMDAGKEKFLFATKSEAMDFISRYSDAMIISNGYAPIRSYKCDCCNGYHITSQPLTQNRYRSTVPMKRMSDGQFQINLRHVKRTLTRAENLLRKAYKALTEQRMQDTQCLCKKCVSLLENLEGLPGASVHRSRLIAKLNDCVERWNMENVKIQKALLRVECRTNNIWSKPWYMLDSAI